ncbi:nucleoside/nucleotide kinase family protein [Kushneria aurantia]|uniref:Nucleoside/nucleotide kinase family protein n=1 Tax=Kushneria aurantia TaxID=504092 RepID=A0ABV6G6A5_9GAMM|nr:nucleoside/nucleotide kinase family protein [Kushneria aurantia]
MTARSQHDISGVDIEEAVVEMARAMMTSGRRRLLGIVGPPGAGKSSIGEMLGARLDNTMQVVPMDGFHLSNRQLTRLGRAERKGAPDTFDVQGYVALLSRLRDARQSDTIYAPDFYRELEEPIAASIAVPSATALVITEGNYLLLEEPPWSEVRKLLDEVWYLDVDTERREQWLVERHRRFGRSADQAHAWLAATDRPNAERIEATRHLADRQLYWDGRLIRLTDR